ncbi:MAG: tryptophan--tRNA ligase [Deltaproteobacteria bacterium CG11_big_fil_rev_8_21_14_0_20_47_16]|nr:MAG: tryptophan--tRNA ligase [Deltaproteobacteria bacterium CG11_big_fil_rev_8_21_14_0_20_47_16]
MSQQRIVSGMRPTGPLHIGNYFGALKNWVALQSAYECFFFVADWHSLTTEYADPSKLPQWTREMAADWLAAGLDPEKATLFIQSEVKEHSELHLLLSMLTPLGWLTRVPTYKELQAELTAKDLNMYGFLGYPLLQTADVALYKAQKVPVGEDQVSHLELCREVVRRFDSLYQKNVFPEPAPLLTPHARVPGLDHRKMSKSYNNAIYLSDTAEEVKKKIMPAVTDPARVRRDDPGNPDVCVIYDYHKLFSDSATVEMVNVECRRAGIGCVDCKKKLLEGMEKLLAPIRDKRTELMQHPKQLDEIFDAGAVKARKVAEQTMTEVRTIMGVK